MPSLQQIRTALDGSGQAHVLRFWPELGSEQQEEFLRELAQLDLPRLEEHCRAAAEAAAAASCAPDRDLEPNLEPVPPESMGSVRRSDPDCLAGWEREGTRTTEVTAAGILTPGFLAIAQKISADCLAMVLRVSAHAPK